MVYQSYGDKTLVVEQGFLQEAHKQVGKNIYEKRVLKDLASYQHVVKMTQE